MRHLGKYLTSLMLMMILALGFVSYSAGQERPEAETRSAIGPDSPSDEIPESAMLTDRGSQLAMRLRILRQSEQSMGEKHPQYEIVQQEIKNIKRELAAWASLENAGLTIDQESLELQVPMMNDRDLRQLVIQLAGKVQQLEDRVTMLEQRPADL